MSEIQQEIKEQYFNNNYSRVKIENHFYIQFKEICALGTKAHSFIHDPDCPCFNKDKK